MGVGQRALERVILAGDGSAELFRVAGKGLEATRIQVGERRLTLEQMNRRALLGPRLGQSQRTR